ncbi:MAG: hypothetical protein ACI9BD_000636 [Candidatus Marinamargulisbacteria bacterium]|jgi:hypothetical protein
MNWNPFSFVVMLVVASLFLVQPAYGMDRPEEMPAKITVEDLDDFEVVSTMDEKEAGSESSDDLDAEAIQILPELRFVQSEIEDKRFSSAIYALNELIDKLRLEQSRMIEVLFPGEIGQFRVVDSGPGFSVQDFQSSSFGVVFSRRYQNKDHHTIDVNVVFSDPSIEEYVNIVKDERLIDGLENTSIVKLKDKIFALEKYSSDENYGERNIVVNPELMVNVVANGIEDRAVLETFCGSIQLDKLEVLLKQ